MADFKINDSHCFRGEGFSILIVQQALESFKAKSKQENDWLYHDDTPIFLDTNVLLNVYMSAVPNRDNILRFLDENKHRVYITNRVQTEYLRHRLEFIDQYKQKLTQCASTFRNTLKAFEFKAIDKVNEMLAAIVKEEFVDSLPHSQQMVEEVKNEISEQDVVNEKYKETRTKLNAIKESFEKEYSELYKKASIEFDDYILDKISQLHILNPLTQEEVQFTIDHYDSLLSRYNKGKDKLADYLRFPGSGESQDSDKKSEPWGDLLIYHEILSFMANEHRDVLFLTYDKSKCDWIKKSGEPYSYYTIDAYNNTQQTLFIRRADDFFTGGYKSIHRDIPDEDSIGITTEISNARSSVGIPEAKNLKYNCISKEEFVHQLKTIIAKNGESKNVHISKSYFIYVVLGKQGYSYAKSFQILDQLRDNKIEEYDYDNGKYTCKCLRLIDAQPTEENN